MTQSEDALAALKQWFGKFPEYLPNKLFVSGESYGGIYVPYLTWQIYQNNQQAAFKSDALKMNLAGMMVGNGATNWSVDVEPSFPATVRYFNIIPPKMFDDFEANNCHYYFYPGFSSEKQTPKCDILWEKISNLAADLNWYDLYRKVYPSSLLDSSKALKASNRVGKSMIDGKLKTYKKGYTMSEYTPWVKHLKSSSEEVILGDYLSDYMNR
jgi:carboxypeptidase C (cathepsin A)